MDEEREYWQKVEQQQRRAACNRNKKILRSHTGKHSAAAPRVVKLRPSSARYRNTRCVRSSLDVASDEDIMWHTVQRLWDTERPNAFKVIDTLQ